MKCIISLILPTSLKRKAFGPPTGQGRSQARGGEACCRGCVATKPCCRRLDPRRPAPQETPTHSGQRPHPAPWWRHRGAPRQLHRCRGGPPQAPGNLTTGPVFSSHFSPLQPFLPEAGKSVRRGRVTQRKCRAANQPLGGGSHIWEGGDGVCPTCLPENCSSRRWFVKSKQRP